MSIKVAICALAKNEDRYIHEWVAYYLNLGVDHIYIYDNNDEPRPIITNLQSNRVTIIPLNGYKSLMDNGFQTGIYTSFYMKKGQCYDWIGFFDIDEFFTLNSASSLDDYFSNVNYQQADVIHVNWRYYGDNNLVFYDNRPVQLRFPNPAPDNVYYGQQFPENNHIKSWVRGHRVFKEINAHTAWFDNAICVHSDGAPSDPHSCFHPYSWNTAQISHYGTKTIDEYIQRRIFCTTRGTGAKQISPETRLEWFFNVNTHTPTKDKLVKYVLTQLRNNL
jgi:hypothetical protein